MQRDVENVDCDEVGSANSGAVLVQSIVGGAIAGTVANVVALFLGYGFWLALLSHSVVGGVAMIVILVLGHTRLAAQAPKQGQLSRMNAIHQKSFEA
ncbi:hypothetical protein [Yoonia sp. 2307UL14-13]|uniref:hypothetical protein n=1 Tax=Yoonia sp. 2307UL14-13 TaxID=3126506 RepID=UPI0030A1CE2C